MHIEVIADPDRFDRLEPDWSRVYAADPEAHFFLSWTWLSGWFRLLGKGWFVLAVKADARSDTYVGFFPLRSRNRLNRQGIAYTEVAMGGSRFADYTGFICRPELERQVARAFARHLAAMPWTVMTLDWLRMSERRCSLFLDRFAGKSYRRRERDFVSQTDDVDLCVAPFVRLPGSWEEYLATRLSANSRQKARRFLRKLDTQDELRITVATEATIERDIRVLTDHWRARWGSRKGVERTEAIVGSFRKMLRHCLGAGTLLMPVLWQGRRALGALVLLVDRPRSALRFQVSGCDTSVNNPPPGFLLHAYCIRRAIGDGFAIYDFLRGNERYKYSFGAEEQRVRWVELHSRRPARSVAVNPGLAVASAMSAPMPLGLAGPARRTQPEQLFRSPLALELERSRAPT